MRKFTVMAVAVAAGLGGGIVMLAPQANAQSAPQGTPQGTPQSAPQAAPAAPPPEMVRPGMGGPGMQGPGMRGPGMQGAGMRPGMMQGQGHWRMGRMMHRLRMFSLIYPAPDRALSGADVQKIVEGFLLWNGNHTWKVTEVTEQADQVTFALATPDGTAIAHFGMNRHTGRLERLN